MASASAAVQPAPVVGNAFVSQYYNVLHQSPHVVHRFYTDESTLTRAYPAPRGVETVSTQAEIHQMVTSVEYAGFKAEIKNVDSQDSLRGGVLVMVTGTLSSNSTGKRNFVQTFFLAPQEKGYFVLNDVLRYLDDGSEATHTEYAMANGPDATVATIPETDLRRESITSDEGYVLAEPEEEPEAEEEIVEPVPAAAEVITEGISPPEVSPSPEPQGEAPKKSYASILLTKDAPPRSAPVKSVPVKTVAAPTSAQTSKSATQESTDEHEAESDKRSVYVKNLTLNTSESELEAEFKKFGTIKAGGIDLRANKQQGYCYAFIAYEDQQSAQDATDASGNVSIGGRPVYVQLRKTTGGGNRGAGRGNYGGGRGDGRGVRGGRNNDYGAGRGGNRGRGDRDGAPRGAYYGNSAAAATATTTATSDNNATTDDGFRNARPQKRSGRNGGGRSSSAVVGAA